MFTTTTVLVLRVKIGPDTTRYRGLNQKTLKKIFEILVCLPFFVFIVFVVIVVFFPIFLFKQYQSSHLRTTLVHFDRENKNQISIT